MTLVLYRTRDLAESFRQAGVFCARSIKPLEGSRPWLRRTRALWRLDEGEQRCKASPRLCRGARQVTARTGCCERALQRRRYGRWKRFVLCQGAEERSARKYAKDSSLRESLHAAMLSSGGERSWISAAVSLSATTIGPPHLGQRQRWSEPEAS